MHTSAGLAILDILSGVNTKTTCQTPGSSVSHLQLYQGQVGFKALGYIGVNPRFSPTTASGAPKPTVRAASSDP